MLGREEEKGSGESEFRSTIHCRTRSRYSRPGKRLQDFSSNDILIS
jgi:hypothetical protein